MANHTFGTGLQKSIDDDVKYVEISSGDDSINSITELNKTDDIDDNLDFYDSLYEENSLEYIISSGEESDINCSKKSKENSYNNDLKHEKDDDCIILDDGNDKSSKKEIPVEIPDKKPIKKKQSKCKKKELKIHSGMKVLALFNSKKHIWRAATIVKIQNASQNNVEYKENSIKLRSSAKYYVKFDNTDEDTNKKNLISEYDDFDENYTQQHVFLNNQNVETKNVNDVNFIEDEVIIVDEENEPIEKKAKTVLPTTSSFTPYKKTNLTNDEKLIEMDATCIAFMQSGSDNPLPNVPYIDYDSNLQTLILPVRSRVISLYSLQIDNSDKSSKLLTSEHLCSATIAELPSARNLKRYLVFFDNGFVSYISPKHAYPIFDLFRLPIDRLSYDHIYFIRYYFESYPERAMVRLDKNDIVKLFINDKWYETKVVDIDVSLVKLTLDNKMFDVLSNKRNNLSSTSHSIWYYRGSYRLLPLYEVINNKLGNGKSDETTQLNQFEKYIKDRQKDPFYYHKKCLSSFASTSFPNSGPISKYKVKRDKDDNKITQGQLKLIELENLIRNEIVKFKSHACSSICVCKWEKEIVILKPVNPLLMPGMHGWQRHICHQSKTLNTGSKKWVNYMAPCGRMLRSTGEVDHYLYLTNSKLTIDMFSFDYFIHTDREFEANAKYLKIVDIADGKENVPISCVNCVDSKRPDNIKYSAHRIPLEDVPLDTSEELMEGCGCEDNCRDRSKCACWRKTFESTTFTNQNQTNTSVGYRGRRLHEMVNTGIFECNSKCKCDHRCSNRVVQNGISLRLQIFKTNNKGWGLRCLDDIAKGSFVCVYAGHLMTEEQSDIRGVKYGDEYFAELDFVECLRRLKQGFVYQSDDEQTESDNSEPIRTEYNPKNNKRTNNKNRFVSRKNPVVTQSSEIDYIFLDSDEDEQDRNERSLSVLNTNLEMSRQAKEFEKSRARNREEKEKKVASSINSNRFFTNQDNRFFYGDYLNDTRIFIMDAKLCGNIGRYFNHSCSPNLFVQNVFVDTYDLRFPWIAFFALNSIKAGNELCWDYNYTIDSVKDRQLLCYCNSTNCRGRLI